MGVLYEIVRHATRRPERSDATGLEELAGVADQQLTVGAAERTKTADVAAEQAGMAERQLIVGAAEQVETSSVAEQTGVSERQPTVGATKQTKTADVAAELLQLSYRSAELELKRQDGRASGWLRLYRKPDA